jgi:hypothetical protein
VAFGEGGREIEQFAGSVREDVADIEPGEFGHPKPGVESKTDNSVIAGAEGRGQVDGAEEPEDRQIVENTHKKPPDENVQRAGPSLHFPEPMQRSCVKPTNTPFTGQTWL